MSGGQDLRPGGNPVGGIILQAAVDATISYLNDKIEHTLTGDSHLENTDAAPEGGLWDKLKLLLNPAYQLRGIGWNDGEHEPCATETYKDGIKTASEDNCTRQTPRLRAKKNQAAEKAGLANLTMDSAQLEAKFKHAPDFAVNEARGRAGFDAFGKAIDSFVSDSGTIRTLGTYRKDPAILNYNPLTSQVVVQALDGAFISGWRMSAAQLRHVIDGGSLGGG